MSEQLRRPGCGQPTDRSRPVCSFCRKPLIGNESDVCDGCRGQREGDDERRRLLENECLLLVALLPEGTDVVARVTRRYIDYRDNRRAEVLAQIGEPKDAFLS